jgi:hypothetical protein
MELILLKADGGNIRVDYDLAHNSDSKNATSIGLIPAPQ